MGHTKFIHLVQVSVSDPNDIYDDVLNSCKNILNKMYLNKTFKGSLIVGIDNIEVGRCITEYERSGGNVLITIKCVMTGVKYDNGEILLMDVIEVTNDAIIGESKFAAVGMAIHDDLQFIKKGDQIPVITAESSYMPYKDKIVISGIMAIPMERTTVEQKIKIAKGFEFIIDEYKETKKEFDNLEGKSKKKLIQQLQLTKKECKMKTHDVMDLVESIGKVVTVSRPNCIQYASSQICFNQIEEDAPENIGYIISIFRDIIKEMNTVIVLSDSKISPRFWSNWEKNRLDG